MHEGPRRPVSLGALPAAGVCQVSHPLGCESLMCANKAGTKRALPAMFIDLGGGGQSSEVIR